MVVGTNHVDSQEDTDAGLQRALHGDREALEVLLNRHRPLMLITARRYLRRYPALRGIHDPEDAVEGALAALWEQARSGELPTIEDRNDLCRVFRKSLSKWIAAAGKHESPRRRVGPGISRSTRVDRSALLSAPPHARVTNPEEPDLTDPTVPAPDLAAMAQERVERLLNLLDKRERDVVDLRVDEVTIEDIAARLKLSERTVNRILKKIRGMWTSSGLLDRPEENRRG